MSQHLIRFVKCRIAPRCGIRMAVLFIAAWLTSLGAAAQQTNPNVEKSIVLNNRAYWLYEHGIYGESVSLLKEAITLNNNLNSNFLLSCIYNTSQKYDSAVFYAEAAHKIDTGFRNVYGQMFTGYYGTEQWEKAQEVGELAEKYGKTNDTEAMLQVVDYAVKENIFSRVMVFLLLAIVGFSIFYPMYKSSKGSNAIPASDSLRFSESILISCTVSCVLWTIFFALSHWIWSQNPVVAPEDIVNYARGFIFEHDGIQSFFLYAMMFVNLVLTLVVTSYVLRTKRNTNVSTGIFTTFFIASAYYLIRIGFLPPLASIDPYNIILPAFFGLLALGLYLLYQKSSLLARIAVVPLVAFTGLIALGQCSSVDFMFLLSPALRWLHGFKVNEIYFQYDLYLSFLIVAWLKLGYAMAWFPYIGQVSYFLLFLGAFFFADGFFKTRGLSVIFIIGFVLTRFYTVWADNPTILQVTPLRLDLWIILLLVAVKKGPRHWLMGLFLGLLILFHRNLGLIYTFAYFELIFILFILDIAQVIRDKQLNGRKAMELVAKHLRLNLVNISLVVAAIALCFLLFHEMFSKSVLLYAKLGLGFKPIGRHSFYGYVSVLLGCLVTYAVFFRSRLGEKYSNTALFVLLLVISNSMYFFGRSHENNILNITGILVIAVFTLFDMLIALAPEEKKLAEPAAKPVVKDQGRPAAKSKKTPAPVVAAKPQPKKMNLSARTVFLALPFVFVLLVSYAYSARIREKMQIQLTNLSEMNFAFPVQEVPMDTASIKIVTHHSSKVYIVDFWYDAYYYYYGGYAPQGFFSPCQSWVYKTDFVALMQQLLNEGYYIVYDVREYGRYSEYLAATDFNHSEQVGMLVAVSKQKTPQLLQPVAGEIFHRAIADTIVGTGMDFPPIKLGQAFSVEVILRPRDNQPSNAGVLDNLTTFDAPRGITLRLNGAVPGQFVFGFGVAKPATPSAVFPLEYNKWHYLAINVNGQSLKVYDNGKLVGDVPSGGVAVANSESDMVVGNLVNLASHFRGEIREVRIMNTNLDEGAITKNAEVINALQ